MAMSSADWVPPGAWLASGYAEWAPPAALRGAVACLWASVVAGGARFRPSAGGAVLGLPLSELRDQRVPLADLLPAAARRLPATLSPAQAAARALDAVGSLVAGGTPDLAVTRAAT